MARYRQIRGSQNLSIRISYLEFEGTASTHPSEQGRSVRRPFWRTGVGNAQFKESGSLGRVTICEADMDLIRQIC